jgi:hypothetical protein
MVNYNNVWSHSGCYPQAPTLVAGVDHNRTAAVPELGNEGRYGRITRHCEH